MQNFRLVNFFIIECKNPNEKPVFLEIHEIHEIHGSYLTRPKSYS